jgi:AcrR family transcriptional regulator
MFKPISEIRRPEIVQAAVAAIKEHGIAMPNYDKIAAQANMSRQLVRHYFPNPEDLMLAVCDALAHAYRRLLLEGILQAGDPKRLPTFLDFYFGFLEGKGLRKPADDEVYDAMFALASTSEPVRKNLHAQYDELQSTIAHEVQISNPQLSQKACREIGFLFVSLMYGHWKMVATLGFSPKYNAVSRAALDRLVASYVDHYVDEDE